MSKLIIIYYYYLLFARIENLEINDRYKSFTWYSCNGILIYENVTFKLEG